MDDADEMTFAVSFDIPGDDTGILLLLPIENVTDIENRRQGGSKCGGQ